MDREIINSAIFSYDVGGVPTESVSNEVTTILVNSQETTRFICRNVRVCLCAFDPVLGIRRCRTVIRKRCRPLRP